MKKVVLKRGMTTKEACNLLTDSIDEMKKENAKADISDFLKDVFNEFTELQMQQQFLDTLGKTNPELVKLILCQDWFKDKTMH